jgi:putative ABC transport system permease protein
VTKERLFYPVTQNARPMMALVLKTARDPLSLVAEVRAAVESIDPEPPIADVRTMEQWVGRSLEGRRTPMMLLALFGGVALVLSAIGIYGVLAFGVTQRAREFGIRQALGADRRAVLRMVLMQGLRTAGLGLAIGLGGALALTRFLSSLLFNIDPTDATTFAAIPALLLVVALLASYLPARRAAAVDPAVSLRYE